MGIRKILTDKDPALHKVCIEPTFGNCRFFTNFTYGKFIV